MPLGAPQEAECAAPKIVQLHLGRLLLETTEQHLVCRSRVKNIEDICWSSSRYEFLPPLLVEVAAQELVVAEDHISLHQTLNGLLPHVDARGEADDAIPRPRELHELVHPLLMQVRGHANERSPRRKEKACVGRRQRLQCTAPPHVHEADRHRGLAVADLVREHTPAGVELHGQPAIQTPFQADAFDHGLPGALPIAPEV
mmetsp:Transcript_153678/g.492648  ORF Transcript_153678/g.492648 Transcript_153678/m.492648 type:complete len:200 (-) Transcript_153678:914-1513(-)